jgi:hypothetical protein
VVALGQEGSPAPETKSQNPAIPASEEKQPSSVESHPRQFGALDILSDTQGVDFGPFLQDMLHAVRENWYRNIPDNATMKKGKLAIEFVIVKDGKVADMKLVATSGDTVLDRAAWGGIAASNPFKPLPDKFTGRYLALRMRFYYNPNKSDLDGSVDRNSPEAANGTTSAPSKSGVVVSISSSGDVYVAAGESRAFTAKVTGNKKQALKWSLSGLGCSKSACGEMVDNLYVAPNVPPMPPVVTLTAIAKADHTAKASVRIHIVQRADSH